MPCAASRNADSTVGNKGSRPGPGMRQAKRAHNQQENDIAQTATTDKASANQAQTACGQTNKPSATPIITSRHWSDTKVMPTSNTSAVST